jgi:hypothetical protein
MLSRFLLFAAFPCCIAALVQGECALAQGKLAYVQGDLFVVFELWFGGLHSLFEHGFVSDVSSRCPCLGGPRLVFFKVILLFAFPWFLIIYWSFFLFISFIFLFSRVTL